MAGAAASAIAIAPTEARRRSAGVGVCVCVVIEAVMLTTRQHHDCAANDKRGSAVER